MGEARAAAAAAAAAAHQADAEQGLAHTDGKTADQHPAAVVPPAGAAAGAAAQAAAEPVKQPCTPRTVLLRVYRALVAQWFILGLGVAIAFAAAVPKLGATGGYIRAEYSVKLPAIITIFIISGLGLKTKALLGAAGDVRIHLLVQGLSLGLVPALGYAIALGLRRSSFDPHLADGLVIMACMPTTVSTNVVYTERAAGNEAAALVNAVLGNIIGIFITPLWLSHFLNVSGAAPYESVLVELTYTIIGPLILGQLLQFFAPRVVSWIKAHINTGNVSSFCILALVWITFCNTFNNRVIRTVPGGDVAGTVFLNVALFALFVAVSFVVAWPPPPLQCARRLLRLKKPDVVAVVICGSTKTVAMGVPLISVMYKQVPYAGLLALPLIVYHALQVLLGGLMLGPLRTWCLATPLLPKAAGGTGGGGGGGGEEEQEGEADAQLQVLPEGAGGGAPPGAGSSRWASLVRGGRGQQQHQQQQQHKDVAAAGGGADGGARQQQ